jgi:hypothetical protein
VSVSWFPASVVIAGDTVLVGIHRLALRGLRGRGQQVGALARQLVPALGVLDPRELRLHRGDQSSGVGLASLD